MEEVSEGIQHLTQENEDPFFTPTTIASKTGRGVQNKSKDNQKQTFCPVNHFILKQGCHNMASLTFPSLNKNHMQNLTGIPKKEWFWTSWKECCIPFPMGILS